MITAILVLAGAGDVLTYVRSGQDGSNSERVVVQAVGPDAVRVVKSREPCTSAAYVTARLDPDSGQALSLVGGSLRRDLEQDAQATLAKNAHGELEVDPGEGGPQLAPVAVAGRWVLYDFDFADWIAHPPSEIGARRDFTFDLPLVWVEQGLTLSNLGQVDMTYAGTAKHEGKLFHYYRAGGPALGGAAGEFWFDENGTLLDSLMPVPNHAEYADFRLRLVKRDSGEAAWRDALAGHWQGCD